MTRNQSFFLTGVHVGAKCKGAILHVEGEAVDLQVTGRDETQHPVPADVTRVVDVDVRTRLGNVIVHAASEYKRWIQHEQVLSPFHRGVLV